MFLYVVNQLIPNLLNWRPAVQQYFPQRGVFSGLPLTHFYSSNWTQTGGVDYFCSFRSCQIRLMILTTKKGSNANVNVWAVTTKNVFFSLQRILFREQDVVRQSVHRHFVRQQLPERRRLKSIVAWNKVFVKWANPGLFFYTFIFTINS